MKSVAVILLMGLLPVLAGCHASLAASDENQEVKPSLTLKEIGSQVNRGRQFSLEEIEELLGDGRANFDNHIELDDGEFYKNWGSREGLLIVVFDIMSETSIAASYTQPYAVDYGNKIVEY
ncbi:MAG: hypothetical protein AAGA25_12755 [Planctomycetota bacterium]